MQKKPLVKLGFAVLVAAAGLFGMNPSPARAIDCPSSYGSCVMVDQICDEEQCCCYYVNVVHPAVTCRDYCV